MPLNGKQDPVPVAVVLVLEDVVTAGVVEGTGIAVELAAAAADTADMDDWISL